jgi:hypothetical protein
LRNSFRLIQTFTRRCSGYGFLEFEIRASFTHFSAIAAAGCHQRYVIGCLVFPSCIYERLPGQAWNIIQSLKHSVRKKKFSFLLEMIQFQCICLSRTRVSGQYSVITID